MDFCFHMEVEIVNSDFFFNENFNHLPFSVFGFDQSHRNIGCNLSQLKILSPGIRSHRELAQLEGASIDDLSKIFCWPECTTRKVIASLSAVSKFNEKQFSIQNITTKKEFLDKLLVCYIPLIDCSRSNNILGFAIKLDSIQNCKTLLSDLDSVRIETPSEFSNLVAKIAHYNISKIESISSTDEKKFIKTIKLTQRELECVELLATGISNYRIAILLNLSVRTVESYIINARNKLDCKNSVELVFKCTKLGII